MTWAALGHLLFGAILNGALVSGAARLALATSSAANDQDEAIERLAKVLAIGAALIVSIVTLGGCVGILDEPGAMLVVTGDGSHPEGSWPSSWPCTTTDTRSRRLSSACCWSPSVTWRTTPPVTPEP